MGCGPAGGDGTDGGVFHSPLRLCPCFLGMCSPAARPDMVDALVARPLPVCYVVACEAAGARDVSSRYIHSLLSAQRNRDELWWMAVAESLPSQRRASAAAGAESDVAVALVKGGDSGGSRPLGRAGAPAVQSHRQQEPVAGGAASNGASSSAPPRGHRSGPTLVDARFSHQRGSMDNPRGAHAAATAAAEAAAEAGAQAGAAATAPGKPRSGHGLEAADMRAAREAAELQHRAVSQMQVRACTRHSLGHES
jgi:hypothetical protein